MMDAPRGRRRYNEKLMNRIEKLCFEKYEEVQFVNEALFDTFLTLSDTHLRVLIKLILNNTYKLINEHVLAGDWEDEDLHEHFMCFLELIFEGKLVFNEEGTMCFVKPLGEPPSQGTWERLQERISASRPVIESVIRETLARQAEAQTSQSSRLDG